MSVLSSLLVVVVLALCFSFASVRGQDFDMMDAANCTDYTNCRDCASQPNCGWCPAFGLCLEGTSANVSTDGTCNVTTGGWHFNATDCRNCSSFKNCKSCVEAYSSKNGAVCGWCEPFGTGKNKTNGTCWEGTAAGPFYKSLTANETCAQKHWGLDSKICGEDDDAKRKLAIIIGLSVAGGLFVLAVVATIIFVIVKRMQRSRGYQAINESA
ncbi:plexin repeat domain containing protein [Acanthamoeba castellanii str. Neff]|uniref:Plexin repeat domain containing protein n=1 Tax=Acanthamoeba castellanii (strain ATCC 30010 / Neff) TaxID=1257118 RepID=L8GM00_ACACF|nr:plexin repeat domain containing protein [Acanthamoeba castellanii str. Neff]ELR13241.1 plexin repeat domain containing protein [Acanthamoeba castellanii str. Neff]